MKKQIRTFIVLTLSLLLFSPIASRADDKEMVASIMNLRADVEALYTRIDENKENYKAQMKSLALQTADSEAQINRAETAIKLADLDLQKIQIKIANTSTENVELRPLLKKAFYMLEESIREGIPFKIDERLSALEKIKKDLEQNLITEEKALALLWASYEDNIRLTSEIGLFKQKIILGEQDVLATVAKIGSVMLYFSTPDNRVGYVLKNKNIYIYKTVDDRDEKKLILTLFEALKKQIRTGYFTIPNALLAGGSR